MTPADVSRLVEALPALPEPASHHYDENDCIVEDWYNDEQMHAYGRQCAAERDAHWAKVVEALRVLVDVCERRDKAVERKELSYEQYCEVRSEYQAAMKAARAALEEQP